MTSAIPVQCSTNWAIKPTGSWSAIVWIRNIPVEEMRWKWIDENSYIWTAEETMNKWISERSSQFYTQLKQLRKGSLKKKIRLERDSNPWPLRYRCSALPLAYQTKIEKNLLYCLGDEILRHKFASHTKMRNEGGACPLVAKLLVCTQHKQMASGV